MSSITFMRYTRLAVAMLSGGSLALFTIVLLKVLDPRFPSINEGVTALPVFGLSASIIYNLTAFLVTSWLSDKRLLVAVSDLTIAVAVAVLGGIGWKHDNNHYLSNGMWKMYDNPGWLEVEIGAGALLIIVVVMHLAIVISTIFVNTSKKSTDNAESLPSHAYPVQKDMLDNHSIVSDGELGKEEAMYASSDGESLSKEVNDVKHLHLGTVTSEQKL
ncbi:hypothetical protein PVAG01_09050 [Phlyctema vagabunda]|uniref:Uncharacterized protein n=1 Tax=Phlyctema vagabunda TaxID=108571 RepID=A0ABR4P699_9HELO